MPPSVPLRALRLLRRLFPQRYVVVHGFYGAGNVGDEAILAATLEEVRRVTRLEPFVFAWDPERVRVDHGVRSMNPNNASRLRAAFVLVQTAAYLLGGGGLIKDYGGDSASLNRWLRWLELAHSMGIKTMLWSIGVENVLYDTSKERLRRVLSSVDVITVRDPSSRLRLQEIGITRPIRVTADPVPYFARAHGAAREGEGVRVVVCLRHWYTTRNSVTDERAFDRLLTALAEGLDHLCERYEGEVVFVPFRTADGDDDRVVSEAVLGRMRCERATVLGHENPTVLETVKQIGGADLVVGMRLHAAVIATALGIPTVAISYMPKVADYMASIDQSTFCADVNEVSGEWLRARVDEGLAQRDAISAQLNEATAELSDRFLQNGQLLADTLERRHARIPS